MGHRKRFGGNYRIGSLYRPYVSVLDEERLVLKLRPVFSTTAETDHCLRLSPRPRGPLSNAVLRGSGRCSGSDSRSGTGDIETPGEGQSRERDHRQFDSDGDSGSDPGHRRQERCLIRDREPPVSDSGPDEVPRGRENTGPERHRAVRQRLRRSASAQVRESEYHSGYEDERREVPSSGDSGSDSVVGL